MAWNLFVSFLLPVKKIYQRYWHLVLVFLLLGSGGCTLRSCSNRKDIPPEEQLHSYINLAVNIVRPEQRQDLIDLTAGSLRGAILSASTESFKHAYIDKRYDFRAFELMERRDTRPGREVEIDFKLVYRMWNAGEREERAPITETENRATLIYEHGRWAVAQVQSLRTNFEWTVGMPLDDVKANGVDPEGPPVEVRSSREEDVESDEHESTNSPTAK